MRQRSKPKERGDCPLVTQEYKEAAKLTPNEPSTHSQVYHKLGKENQQKSEMAQFETLRGAEEDRVRPPEALAVPTKDETKPAVGEERPADE